MDFSAARTAASRDSSLRKESWQITSVVTYRSSLFGCRKRGHHQPQRNTEVTTSAPPRLIQRQIATCRRVVRCSATPSEIPIEVLIHFTALRSRRHRRRYQLHLRQHRRQRRHLNSLVNLHCHVLHLTGRWGEDFGMKASGTGDARRRTFTVQPLRDARAFSSAASARWQDRHSVLAKYCAQINTRCVRHT